MTRNRDDLQRRRPYRQPKPRFLIVCEGRVTEPRYFKDVQHTERSLIDLEIEVQHLCRLCMPGYEKRLD